MYEIPNLVYFFQVKLGFKLKCLNDIDAIPPSPPPNSNLYHPNLNLLKHISKILVSKNQLDIEMDITMFYSLSSSIFNFKKKRVHFLT
jgi:hypothetical protein